MVNAIYLAALVQFLLAAPAAGTADYVCLERLSPRVVLAYGLGVDRRC